MSHALHQRSKGFNTIAQEFWIDRMVISFRFSRAGGQCQRSARNVQETEKLNDKVAVNDSHGRTHV